MKDLYKVNKDVTTRFVYRELGQTNINGRLLEECYHRNSMRQTDIYYTDLVQSYNITTDQSGELSRLSLLHLIDSEEKLKKLLRAVTDDENPTLKLLNVFEKEGSMPSERIPYLM